MTNTSNEPTGLDHIAAGVQQSDDKRRRGAKWDPARAPFSADPEVLAARVKADPTLWELLAPSQRIAVGFHQREQEQIQDQQKGN